MRAYLAFAVAVVGLVASCPQDPPDAREFITAIFNTSKVCVPTFLAQAEPVFLDAQSRAQIEVAIDTFNRDLANDKVTFDRARFDECLAGAKANDCDVVNVVNGPCSLVFTGKVESGDACAEGVECAAGLDCFQDRNACGTCTTLALQGTSCAEANCSGGNFCNDQQICAEKPQPASFDEGQLCSLAQGCGGVLSGLACAADADAGGTTCQAIDVVEEGDACSPEVSSTQYCKDSTTTHSCIDNVCVARPKLGEPCNAAGACDAREAACVNGACVDAGEQSDACDDGRGCKLGFACREGFCAALTQGSVPPQCD